jgi:hypothetical protein
MVHLIFKSKQPCPSFIFQNFISRYGHSLISKLFRLHTSLVYTLFNLKIEEFIRELFVKMRSGPFDYLSIVHYVSSLVYFLRRPLILF